LSVVIWNKWPTDARFMLVLQVVGLIVAWAYMVLHLSLSLESLDRSLQGSLLHEKI